MAIVLFNPTSDELRGMQAGIELIIPPCPKEGHMVKVDDRKANHLLNELGPRGLTSLEFGDEGEIKERKAAAGIKRAKQFKLKQIERYNQDNETRKATNQGYIAPSKQIQEFAKELGEGLIQPYRVKDVANEEIAELKSQLKQRDSQFADLTQQFSEFMSAYKEDRGIKSKDEIAKEKEDAEREKLHKEYKMLPWVKYKPWVNALGARYMELPVDVQKDLEVKWNKMADEEEKFPY